jgi:hypothetical protein
MQTQVGASPILAVGLALGLVLWAFTSEAQVEECSCPEIEGLVYGIDPNGTVEKFDFASGSSASVPAPSAPSLLATGLAVDNPFDAFFVNGFGEDEIFEFDPVTGALIPGPFPLDAPGFIPDGLAVVEPGKLAVMNKFSRRIRFIRTSDGAALGSISVDGLPIGALAGGAGRLFARLGFTEIAEIDMETGAVIRSFPAPDLNGNFFPDLIEGMAFDGELLYVASISAPPPNVAALDPETGALIGVSPYIAPSGVLVALGTNAGAGGETCDPAETVLDNDGDGIPNACDICPDIADPNQENFDDDAWGDACDLCPELATQQETLDSEPPSDPNGPDFVGDACDNCPLAHNPEQNDTNESGRGDACERTALIYDISSVGGVSASSASASSASAFPTSCGPDVTTLQLNLQCGAETINEAASGFILGLSDPNCVEVPRTPGCNATDCTAIPLPDPGLGDTVDRALSSAVFPGSGAVLPTRDDTLYFKFVGAPLCNSGQTVPLAQVSWASGDPGALPPTTDEGLPAGFDGVVNDEGTVLPKEQIEIKTNENAEFVVTIQPAVNESVGVGVGVRWEVLGRAPLPVHLVTVGFRGCVGVLESEMSFGGCLIQTGTPGERECTPGSGAAGADLGPTVDTARSFGPSPTSDIMFVELTGNVDIGEDLDALNPQGGTDVLLGVITMTCSPGLQAGITYQDVSSMPGFQAVFIDAETGESATNPSLVGFETAFDPPDDSDGDWVSEEVDNCRYKKNFDQLNTGRFFIGEEDPFGDVCFCGEVTGDGVITQADILKQQELLAGGPVDPDDADRASVDLGTTFSLRDKVITERALSGLAGGDLKQVCLPATPIN